MGFAADQLDVPAPVPMWNGPIALHVCSGDLAFASRIREAVAGLPRSPLNPQPPSLRGCDIHPRVWSGWDTCYGHATANPPPLGHRGALLLDVDEMTLPTVALEGLTASRWRTFICTSRTRPRLYTELFEAGAAGVLSKALTPLTVVALVVEAVQAGTTVYLPPAPSLDDPLVWPTNEPFDG